MKRPKTPAPAAPVLPPAVLRERALAAASRLLVAIYSGPVAAPSTAADILAGVPAARRLVQAAQDSLNALAVERGERRRAVPDDNFRDDAREAVDMEFRPRSDAAVAAWNQALNMGAGLENAAAVLGALDDQRLEDAARYLGNAEYFVRVSLVSQALAGALRAKA